MRSLLAVVCLLICVAHNLDATKSHPITTLLNAKWKTTPIYLEVAEFLFDESPNSYWDYVKELLQVPISKYGADDDLKVYKASVSAAEKLIGPIQLPLLKLALSMHSMSPRVQAHFQIANEILEHGDCNTSTFVTIGNRVACNMDELEKGLKKIVAKKQTADEEEEDVHSFDHIWPGSENNTVTTILYSDMGSKEFKTFHEYLVKQADGGVIKYVARHFVRNPGPNRVRLSGYGVELHLKSTEYKSQDDAPRSDDQTKFTDDHEQENEVEGFDFKVLKQRYPSLAQSLDQLRSSLLEKSDEIAPLKAWEFQDLSLQAAARVAAIQGDEALQILQFTAQNFPSQAKSLLHVRVSDDFKKEMKHNADILSKDLTFQAPDSSIYINGLYFDAETIDMVTLLETLRSEIRVLNGLHKLSIKGSIASDLLALDLSHPDSIEFAVDIRDSAINWINDIEKDSKYRSWPSSIYELLRPSFPGMVRSLRKNLFNVVIIIDPLSPEIRAITKLVESFVVHAAPIRCGIVFDTTRRPDSKSQEVYRVFVSAWNYISQLKTPEDSLSFLTDLFAVAGTDEVLTIEIIQNQFKKARKELDADEINEILGEDSDYDYGRQLAEEFVKRLGFEKSPQALMNGVPIEESLLNEKKFEEAILTEVLMATAPLQKAVFNGELTDDVDSIDYVMKKATVMPRLNQRIMAKNDAAYLDLTGKPHTSLENVNLLAQLSNRDMTATLLHNLQYFSLKKSTESILGNKHTFLTVKIVADLETRDGIDLMLNALSFLKSASGVRLAFIPNTEGAHVGERKNLNRLVWAALNALPADEAFEVVKKWIDQDANDRVVPDAVAEVYSETELHMKLLRVYAQRVLQLKAGQRVVITNGKVIGPLKEGEIFNDDDFSLIERLHAFLHGDKIRKALKKFDYSDELDNIESHDADLIVKLIGLLAPRQAKTRITMPKKLQDAYTTVKLSPKQSNLPYIDIFAALDPASRGAQKLAPILILLRSVVNCRMHVVLSTVQKHSDMPVKSFYRFVVEPELQFTAEGKLTEGPYAKFVGVPAAPLLTQNLQIPENWLVEVVRSVYDLDNIKLIDINGPVHSEYELEYLLLEGHCFDSFTGSPPRGLQITLGTKDKPTIVDTIVMANLGYLQLKANPGAWVLRLRHGKSDEIYDITQADGANTVHSADGTRVIINSFKSHVIKLRVTKKTGQEKADLLADGDDANSGIWNSITSSFSGGTTTESPEPETINIFSVASGHLYERLLRIMMLSLMKHTKQPVKFWFLKNYLSPQFIDILPHMANEYNFKYELVQYKWPRWLHQQTEKQRTIWGYKILFLDVLFPLDVKKIIFVDADAVVRSDINELNTMDLGGAPYAYTPFCDSRKEMDGFRFWTQGYWRNHLQHRKYHISALYVVDLRRFRKVAAGDRLRGQYQALSQDPNSLANLDQDLPNNMIHQVAIKSLPQEWLWCQTWCSDREFSSAKVIDLCNNPQTKEAKLTAAERIVPEWKDYDNEIKALMGRIAERGIEPDEVEEVTEDVIEQVTEPITITEADEKHEEL